VAHEEEKVEEKEEKVEYEMPFTHTPGRWMTLGETLPRLTTYKKRRSATGVLQLP